MQGCQCYYQCLQCLQLAMRGSRSALCNSLNIICDRHGLIKQDLLQGTFDKKRLGHLVREDNLAMKGAQIRELLAKRDYGWDFLTRVEICSMLEFLCTE